MFLWWYNSNDLTSYLDDSTDATPSSADGSSSGGVASNVDVAVAKTSAAATADFKRDVTDQSLQTDPFFVYPYEHLFPSVLPNMFPCQHGKVSFRWFY